MQCGYFRIDRDVMGSVSKVGGIVVCIDGIELMQSFITLCHIPEEEKNRINEIDSYKADTVMYLLL